MTVRGSGRREGVGELTACAGAALHERRARGVRAIATGSGVKYSARAGPRFVHRGAGEQRARRSVGEPQQIGAVARERKCSQTLAYRLVGQELRHLGIGESRHAEGDHP